MIRLTPLPPGATISFETATGPCRHGEEGALADPTICTACMDERARKDRIDARPSRTGRTDRLG